MCGCDELVALALTGRLPTAVLALIAGACGTEQSRRHAAQNWEIGGDFAIVADPAVTLPPTDEFFLLGQAEGRRHAENRRATCWENSSRLSTFPISSRMLLTSPMNFGAMRLHDQVVYRGNTQAAY